MTAKAIMIQGTGSNVGKSLIATALCRIFSRDGYRVAPFKAQNMALNSYVTSDGGEMGRAQVVQAEAAGIEPSVEMNPILLKPTADTGSQVIAMGRPIGNMTAKEYFSARTEMLQVITKAFKSLSERHDIIVIEGAGSPAEINLKDKDIVNMKMAELANAPVILVTDVDQGGAFAWIIGTLELLQRDERARMCGFIFNKFRGDPKLIEDRLKMLESRTGLPVLGLIPYLRDINLDEEDSVWLDHYNNNEGVHAGGDVDIAVIRLPRLSNFTDFNILGKEKSVRLRYVDDSRTLGQPDMIILPGTKSTIKDLQFIRERGLAQALTDKVRNGTMVMGICGGYQMLGTGIEDKNHIESSQSFTEGLGLLDVSTTFLAEKQTFQVKAVMEDYNPLPFHVDGVLSGYEIHMGNSKSHIKPLLRIIERGGRPVDIMDGAVSTNGQVIGTYLHGLFDNDEFRQRLTNYLRTKNGAEPIGNETHLSSQAFKEGAYNRLASVVRENLRIEVIYDILDLKRS
ncbi:MAG: cobyric acid synthase [Candidatus Brocadiales bacterium]